MKAPIRKMAYFARTFPLYSILPIVIGLATYGLTYYGVHRGQRIEFPEVVDVGSVEQGKTETAYFIVTNNGTEDLVLDHVRTSCTCLTVSTKTDHGSFRPIGREIILPGESISLYTSLTASGFVGQDIMQYIHLSTNDPRQSEITVSIKGLVKGTVISEPSVIALGDVQPGEKLEKSFLLINNRLHESYILQNVKSSSEDSVKILNVTHLSDGVDTARRGYVNRGGKAIYDIRLSICVPQNPGRFKQVLSITEEASESPILVPVQANVLPSIEFLPSVIFLPRMSDKGLIYKATCTFRSTMEGRINLKLRDIPKGLVVTTTKGATDSSVFVNIELGNKCQSIDQKPVITSIPILAHISGNNDVVVDLPVLIWNGL